MDWSREEVEATVADYFHMLMQELAGQDYNKSAHRRALREKLANRTDTAIEYKHQNISAILIEFGCPSIIGYKPRGNYQALLSDVVADRLRQDRSFDQAAISAVEMPITAPIGNEFRNVLVDAPALAQEMRSPKPAQYVTNRIPIKRDYLDREARNIALGTAGEEFVLSYEQARLHAAGHKKLADRVDHVSKTKGDGLGYDVLSFDPDGRERFIEVKTTSFGKETPFFISKGEVEFSTSHADHFHLYRLFGFRKNPQLFDLRGPVNKNCFLDPVTYVGRFSQSGNAAY